MVLNCSRPFELEPICKKSILEHGNRRIIVAQLTVGLTCVGGGGGEGLLDVIKSAGFGAAGGAGAALFDREGRPGAHL